MNGPEAVTAARKWFGTPMPEGEILASYNQAIKIIRNLLTLYDKMMQGPRVELGKTAMGAPRILLVDTNFEEGTYVRMPEGE